MVTAPAATVQVMLVQTVVDLPELSTWLDARHATATGSACIVVRSRTIRSVLERPMNAVAAAVHRDRESVLLCEASISATSLLSAKRRDGLGMNVMDACIRRRAHDSYTADPGSETSPASRFPKAGSAWPGTAGTVRRLPGSLLKPALSLDARPT